MVPNTLKLLNANGLIRVRAGVLDVFCFKERQTEPISI